MVDSTNGAGIGVSADLNDAKWVSQTTRTAGGLVVTAKREDREGDARKVQTITLTWIAPPAPASAAPAVNVKMAEAPRLESGKGMITFTQNGKQATWPMNSLVTVNNGPVASVSLMYTPDGGQPSEDRGVLALTVMNVMGQTMVTVNLTKGPAGDATFENEHCTVQSTTVGGKTQGTGECKNGKDVVKFTFTAAK